MAKINPELNFGFGYYKNTFSLKNAVVYMKGTFTP